MSRKPILSVGAHAAICPCGDVVTHRFHTRWGEARAERRIDRWWTDHQHCEPRS